MCVTDLRVLVIQSVCRKKCEDRVMDFSFERATAFGGRGGSRMFKIELVHTNASSVSHLNDCSAIACSYCLSV